MLKRSWLAVILGFLVFLPASARADTTGYTFTYADLQKIFVQNQQYFVLDDDGANDASLNHLHFTSVDATDGVFTGALWAPVVVPAVAPVTVPVFGKLTIHTDLGIFGLSSDHGYYYEITFFWAHGDACEGQQASYKGAITFRGYQGGVMRGNVAGVIRSTLGTCGGGDLPSSPQPFAGKLTK
ncbi:MAG TPA: hypothetical protein VGV37_03145 [Aliidongia sp.]|uniref:hypothetical protein n=1 Tax=Aliidongia sp. TaxID=1914230 RepID=UPI002DDD2C2E|nr:hypothetical protein [Aliidongia sp.]HEV2673510.1 hypothetical protein [Aliidongia sp.]